MRPAHNSRWRRSAGSAVVALAVSAGALPGQTFADTDAIVVAGPLSGRYAWVGAVMRESTHGAAGDLKLQFQDDTCSAEGARLAAQKIVALRPAVVIGHPCSSAAIAAAAIYAEAGIPFIATGPRHPALTDARAGPLVFRLAGRDDRQGDAAAQALSLLGGSDARFALLHDRTVSMRALAERTQAVLAAEGIAGETRVKQFPFVASELDYTDLAKRVAAFLISEEPEAKASSVLIAAFPQEAILIVRALRAQNVMVPIVGSEALADTRFGQAASWARLVVLSPGDHNLGRAAGMYVTAALRMWEAALRVATAEPSRALAARTVLLPDLGAISFTANGDANVPSYTLNSWKEGRWHRVQSRDFFFGATSEDGYQKDSRP